MVLPTATLSNERRASDLCGYMTLAARMMLDWLGETRKARALGHAVAGVILEGKVRTYDMGGSATTIEMAQAIADKVMPAYQKLSTSDGLHGSP